MNVVRLVSTGTALLLVCGCGNGRDATPPTAPDLAPQGRTAERSAGAGQVQTSGQFDAQVDFSTVTLTPKGNNCLLEVDGRLVFTGTIIGTAIGHTSALEFAPCSEVAVNPPGTFPDVFKSVAVFDGTVDGVPAHSNLLYMGQVAVGGHIDGRLVFSNGVAGKLDVSAVVAVGGEYSGALVVK
ncbi:MAG TPA: hypothetical protein VFI52_06490 [Gemmatimonadaceae bacterium]|nr:hypothetical protein [Gemmatimonadaceae bacterium]